MLFVAIIKGDVSLISLSAHLSFVYRRDTDFFELILYPATLLKVLISCRSSLVEFLASLIYTISNDPKTLKELLNILSHQGNAKQNDSEIPSYTCQKG